MIVTALLIAALLLSIERITYLLIWNYPDTFRTLVAHPALSAFREPVDVLQKLFYCFKALQLGVFFGWCIAFADGIAGLLPAGGPLTIAVGTTLLVVGQVLNSSVFYRLGKAGVFYGNKLGYEIPWQKGFPFSWLSHPQYVGTLLSIWGFFVIMRFPHDDWILLPLLQTFYYALGAHFES